MTSKCLQTQQSHQQQSTSVLLDGDDPIVSHARDKDEQIIMSLGYKQEFKREFSLWTTFCVSFSVLGLLPSFASTLWYGMGYAGTAGMVWGWIIAMIFIQCVAMGMAELCSSMPTSGGLYYAAAVLAPGGQGPFAAWITGWSSWMGQVMGAPSVNYGTAGMILAAGSIYNPSFVPQPYQTFLLTTGIMLIHGVISSMPTKWIAEVNSYGSLFNLLSLIVVIIAIPAGTTNSPRFNSSADVWGTIYKGTSFPDGVAVLMSFVSVIWTMSGAIVLTSAVGGLMGWLLQVVVAYTVKDIDVVLHSELGQPWASFLFQVMSRRMAVAILALTIICGFSMGQACMIAASRVTYAYARDDCLPLSRIWKKVDRHTMTPVNAVWLNCVIGILSTLLIFAGDLAMGALFSIGGIASFAAFMIPIAIRVFFVKDRFRPGPWNLGRYSRVIGGAGVAFVVLMIPILCLPTHTGSRLTLRHMNWTCVVYGGPMLGVLLWWILDARKWFKGPKVKVKHRMLDHVQIGVEWADSKEERVPQELESVF